MDTIQGVVEYIESWRTQNSVDKGMHLTLEQLVC